MFVDQSSSKPKNSTPFFIIIIIIKTRNELMGTAQVLLYCLSPPGGNSALYIRIRSMILIRSGFSVLPGRNRLSPVRGGVAHLVGQKTRTGSDRERSDGVIERPRASTSSTQSPQHSGRRLHLWTGGPRRSHRTPQSMRS